MEIIDAESLIDAVHSHPAIWNMLLSDYADRLKKKAAWDEVTEIFAGDDATEEKKKLLGTQLQKKWKNIRDRYSREVTAKKKKGNISYMYSTQLSFLFDIIKNRSTASSAETSGSMENEAEQSELSDTDTNHEYSTGEPSFKKAKLDGSEDHFLFEATESAVSRPVGNEYQEEEDADRLFLLSLLPTMKSVPKNLKLDARIEILQCLQKYVNNHY